MLNIFKRPNRRADAPRAASGAANPFEDAQLTQAAENEARRQASDAQHRQEAFTVFLSTVLDSYKKHKQIVINAKPQTTQLPGM